jgi:hypothetical protein
MGTRRSSPLAVLLGAVLAGGLIAGCAGGRSTGGPAAPGGSVSTSPSDGSSSGGSATPSPSLSATGPPLAEMTLTGTVEEGVEPNCVILHTEGKTYLLLGGDRAVVKFGAKVKVRGRPQPNMVSHCMQGEPFQVLEAHPV